MVVIEGKQSELTVDPASARSHEFVRTFKLLIHVLLQHHLAILLVLLLVHHMVGEQAKCVHEGLLMSKILRLLSAEILRNHLQIVGEI